MSFSSAVKNELCRIEAGENCCLLAELSAVIDINATVKSAGDKSAVVTIVTENAAFARRLFSILKKLYHIYPEVTIRKSRKFKKHVTYTLTALLPPNAFMLTGELKTRAQNRKTGMGPAGLTTLLKKVCCRKSYLRGAFLAGGSISDPEKTYHLELTCRSLDVAERIRQLLGKFKLNAKVVKRKGSLVTYIKEGEDIVNFLNVIGAHTALMELENVRILKEMRNNVNRIVNCETANLEKTINASLRQIENIRYIKDNIGFENLPENLREIAEMRLLHSDANLKELGEMLASPLGKSGVNHRLRKLNEIAERARNLKKKYSEDEIPDNGDDG